MHKIQSASALLCESVRPEISGSVTAIGIYTGNITLTAPAETIALATLISLKTKDIGKGTVIIKLDVVNEVEEPVIVLMIGELDITTLSQMVILGPSINIHPKHDCKVTVSLITLEDPPPETDGLSPEEIEARAIENLELLSLTISVGTEASTR